MPDYGWLGGVLAATVLAAAAYSVSRVVVGPLRGRRVHYDVDITHALMGAGMAGMFVTNLSFLSTAIWQATFAVIIAWYAIRAILGSQNQYSPRPELLYQTGHLLSLAAMLYMLHATPMNMPMPSTSTAPAPALTLLFAALLLGYVVLVTNRARQAIRAHIPADARRLPLAPRAGAACEVVMCAAMTVMLITAL